MSTATRPGLTPFGGLLGPQWLTAVRAECNTIIVLHRDLGAWFEADAGFVRGLSHEDAYALVRAMDAVTEAGLHVVEAQRTRNGLTARAVRLRTLEGA